MIKMHFFRKFAQFLVLFCLTACTTTPKYDDLINSPCTAPCWYGVIPGKTSKDELVKLIPAFPRYQKNRSTWLDDKSQVSQSVPETSKALFAMSIGDSLAGLQIDLDENIVSSIRISSILNKSFEYKNLGLTLGNAISTFGKPSDLFLEKDLQRKFQKLFLVYSDQGVLVAVETQDLTSNITVRPSLPIRDVAFFIPPYFQVQLSKLTSIGNCNLFPFRLSWQGFTTISFPHNLQECY